MKSSATSARAAPTCLDERIRAARIRANLSKAELARRVGVSPSAVVQWEQAGGSKPCARHLGTIAQCTGAAFEWLATGRGPMRISESDGPPAIEPTSIAVTLFEERLLEVARRLPSHCHEALIEFLRAWTTKSG
jgi:transcriptional regulator with XRE-family HTH domain